MVVIVISTSHLNDKSTEIIGLKLTFFEEILFNGLTKNAVAGERWISQKKKKKKKKTEKKTTTKQSYLFMKKIKDRCTLIYFFEIHCI